MKNEINDNGKEKNKIDKITFSYTKYILLNKVNSDGKINTNNNNNNKVERKLYRGGKKTIPG